MTEEQRGHYNNALNFVRKAKEMLNEAREELDIVRYRLGDIDDDEFMTATKAYSKICKAIDQL